MTADDPLFERARVTADEFASAALKGLVKDTSPYAAIFTELLTDFARAYAAERVAEEREACAMMVWAQARDRDEANALVAAIRARSQP